MKTIIHALALMLAVAGLASAPAAAIAKPIHITGPYAAEMAQ